MIEADVELVGETVPASRQSSLPSPIRLVVFAVLLPAVVVASNQALQIWAPENLLSNALFPWLILSAGSLSWCAGRFLRPEWFGWLIFVWCCAFLDLLTIIICYGVLDRRYAYGLVCAQIGFLTLWAILGNSSWQWRLPAVLVFVPAVCIFARLLTHSYNWFEREWFALIILTTVVVVALCALLRAFGFSALRIADQGSINAQSNVLLSHQFGIRHMLLWATALVPLLLVGRGLDFFVFKVFGDKGTFQILALSLAVATINLTAIWAVLGRGLLILRLAILIFLPLALGTAVIEYSKVVQSFRFARSSPYPQLIQDLFRHDLGWTVWFFLNSALLAAMLLFLRAQGYRLARRGRKSP
jgi:hypothetical protein